MKLEITKKECRWLVNGKPYSELNDREQRFMDDFFREVKLGEVVHKNIYQEDGLMECLDCGVKNY